MNRYRIKIKLLSEAMFGSGRSVPGSVDSEIVYDSNGLPYMKAKTFKGNLRETMEEFVALFENKSDFKETIKDLIGDENLGLESWKNLKLSDCRISEGVRAAIENEIASGKLNPEEVKSALTSIRAMTSINEDGSARRGSLRQIRVIKKGTVFQSEIHSERELSETELGLLASSLRMLRHIGSMRSRGKGEVECSLEAFENGSFTDRTDHYIDLLMKEVKFDD